jgi:SRSO17 transposase
MIKIIRIPKEINKFFKTVEGKFFKKQYRHFCNIVLAMAISYERRNISAINRLIVNKTHRTSINHFVTESKWKYREILNYFVYQELMRLKIKPGDIIYLIIDETHKGKRGKIMACVDKFIDPISGNYMIGHTTVNAIIYCKAIIIPYATYLYAKKEYCKTDTIEFKKMTQITASIIRSFNPPEGVQVIVIFDSFYMCKEVISAVKEKNFHYVSTLKSNRNIIVNGKKKKVKQYGKGVLSRDIQKVIINIDNNKKTFIATERFVIIPKIGNAKVVFSKRHLRNGKTDKKFVAIVTDLDDISIRDIIQIYSYRWFIEVYFKNLKQTLGFGQYQNLDYESVVKHLHLTLCAYLLLTHLKINLLGAKGKKQRHNCSKLYTIGGLQNHLRYLVFLDLKSFIITKSNSLKSLDKFINLLKAA